jgi:hypothetical protein
MATSFKTSGKQVHIVLAVALLAACAANLVLVVLLAMTAAAFDGAG